MRWWSVVVTIIIAVLCHMVLLASLLFSYLLISTVGHPWVDAVILSKVLYHRVLYFTQV